MKYLFLDTETTGVDKNRNGIHQISGSIIIDNVIVEVFDYKFKPFNGCEIDDSALEVCDVTKEELLYRTITENEVYKCLIKLLSKYVNKYNKSDKFFLVGYNVHFDKEMLYEMFVRNGDNFLFSYIWGNHIDVMVLATTKLLDCRYKMENFKQGTVAKFLGFNFDEKELHDALFDIYICIGIYCHITGNNFSIGKNISKFNEYEASLNSILDEFAKPLKSVEEIIYDTIINFGKYKGQRLGDVINSDSNYIIWLYENAKNQNIISTELYNKLKNKQPKKKIFGGTNDKVIDHQLESQFDCDDNCW